MNTTSTTMSEGTNMTTKIEFSTTEFSFSHGKEPRGYGSWAFEIPGSMPVWFAPASTYADAKKVARAHVLALIAAAGAAPAYVLVNVCP
jgi:hypothetical protein